MWPLSAKRESWSPSKDIARVCRHCSRKKKPACRPLGSGRTPTNDLSIFVTRRAFRVLELLDRVDVKAVHRRRAAVIEGVRLNIRDLHASGETRVRAVETPLTPPRPGKICRGRALRDTSSTGRSLRRSAPSREAWCNPGLSTCFGDPKPQHPGRRSRSECERTSSLKTQKRPAPEGARRWPPGHSVNAYVSW